MIAPSDINFEPAPVETISQRDLVGRDFIRTLQLGMNWFPEEPGGLDRYYYDMMHHFPAAGVEAHGLVCGSAKVKVASRGAVRSAVGPETRLPGRLMAFRRSTKQDIAEFNPDVIGTHFALYTLPALGCFKNKPLIAHFHGPWHKEARVEGHGRLNCWARYQAERAVYTRAQRLITLSDFIRKELVRCFSIDESRVTVIPGGVDVKRFDVAETRAEAREQLGWAKDRPIILTVRRLMRRMGLENVIQAASIIREKCPDALILIAGSGRLREELEQQIKSLGLQDNVKLLGFLPDEDLPLAYRAADLSIVPSISLEGFGLVAVESLAAGTPVIVTPVGGLPEIIRPFREELLARGTTAKHLADVMIPALLDLHDLPSKKECKQYADQYDWSVVTASIRKVFASVM